MKRQSFLCASLLAGVMLQGIQAEIIYRDDFDDTDPAVNTYAGNFIQGNESNPITEANSSVSWAGDLGGNWGGSNIQSMDVFDFPEPGKKYSIEWVIGPMAVTASGESWGDIRMQLALLSMNSGQGSTGSQEFWSLTAGGFGIDIAYKNGQAVYANFVGKNDSHPADLNPVGIPGQTGHQIDPTQNHTLRIELTATEASLYVDGALSQTNQLFQWGLGGGTAEEFGNGFFLQTRSARANTGRGTTSVAGVTVDLSDVEIPPPPPLPSMAIEPTKPGLRLIATGGQYDRQCIRTTVPEFSWVEATLPMSYYVTISEYPTQPNFTTVIYLVPGSGLEIWRNAPDWSQPVCAVASINNNADGTASMRFAYKNHTADSNGHAGHEYWIDDDGSVVADGEPGVVGAGKGGTIAFLNSSTVLGTWTVSFNTPTEVTLIAPDEQSITGTFQTATSALFEGPLYAYFGVVPNDAANPGLSATFASVGIVGGGTNLISESFTAPLNPAVLEKLGVNPLAIMEIMPEINPYWVRWSVPDTDFAFQQSSTLSTAAPWQDYPANDALILRGEKWKLITAAQLLDARANFFRLFKP